MLASILTDSTTRSPAVVFVPGIDGTGELLLGTAERLERRFRLLKLRYELPDEAAPLNGDGYAPLGDSIIACLDAAGIDRAVLLAESFGVSLALRTALDHPDRVSGLALVNGFAYYDRRIRLALSSTVTPLVPGPLFRLGRRCGATFFLFGPRRDRAIERAFTALQGNPFDAGFRRRLEMIARVDLRDELPSMVPPVALFASTHDRIVPSVRAARVMHEALPNATLELLGRSGHIVLPFPDEPWVERIEALCQR